MLQKNVLFLILFTFLFSFQGNSQWTHTSFYHDSLTRDYWIYVPPTYSSSNPASIVVTLHGMGDNDTNFRNIGFNYVADTANIIVLVPNAVPFHSDDPLVEGIIGGSRTWNSGAGTEIPFIGEIYPNSNVDDIGFINEMVDRTINDYSVDQTRVYICGFSMGGFMTQRMAIQSNNRYAAFATAAGTIGNGLINTNPGRPIPIAHFNGTADQRVNWEQYSPMFELYVDSMVTFWIDNNNCDTVPIQTQLPDIKTDSFTVDHYVYGNGDNGSVLEVFKVNNAAHIWLGASNDISYTIEMWKFFSRYSFQYAGMKENEMQSGITIFPNPTDDFITITSENSNLNNAQITIHNSIGKEVLNTKLSSNNEKLNIKNFNSGTYFITIQTKKNTLKKKIIIQ